LAYPARSGSGSRRPVRGWALSRSRHGERRAPSCAPIRRRIGGGIDDIKYLPLTKQSQWTLHATSSGGAYVQRCRSRRTLRLPRVSSAVLGIDFVGYLQRRRIVYLDLRSGRRSSRAWPTEQTPLLAAAGRRLIISAPEQPDAYPAVPDPTYRIYRSR